MDIWRTTAGFLNDNILEYLSAATGKDFKLGGMKIGSKRLGDPPAAAPGAPEKSPAVKAAEDILENATKGQAEAASDAVKALQAELAALQQQAASKVDEMKQAEESSSGVGGAGGGFGGGGLGKASAATFSLASLAQSVGRGFESKQLSALQKQNALGEQQVDKLDGLIAAVGGLGMHHA